MCNISNFPPIRKEYRGRELESASPLHDEVVPYGKPIKTSWESVYISIRNSKLSGTSYRAESLLGAPPLISTAWSARGPPPLAKGVKTVRYLPNARLA